MGKIEILPKNFDYRSILSVADKHGIVQYEWRGETKYVLINRGTGTSEDLTEEEVKQIRTNGKL